MGGPLATGAALACPGRPVFALLGDGGALYSLQALWTQARESLPVITLIYNNRRYNILDHEYRRLGINEVAGRKASSICPARTSTSSPWRRVSVCPRFA